jgi:glycosyltransferase involved in cell wall biosynthesis
MTDTLRVAYINSFAYANGAANSARADGLIEALEFGSATVARLTHDTYISSKWNARLKRWGLRRIPKVRTLVMGTVVSEWLSALEPRPELLVVLGTDPRFLRPARRWAAQHAVPIVNDVVDWYSIAEGGSVGEKIFIALNNLWAMPFESARCDGAVVVSRSLAKYYERHGVPNLRASAVMACEDTSSDGQRDAKKFSADGRLHLAYVGNPGKRDLATIRNLIALGSGSTAVSPDVVIHIVGWEHETDASDEEKSFPNIIEYGRLPRQGAVNVVARSDFTVLQRPAHERFAQAGFPSKIAESLMLGTPVISNATSDLAEYVSDGVNGIMLDDDSFEQLQQGVRRAARWLAGEAPDKLRIQQSAHAAFSSRAQANALRAFLNDVMARGKGSA